MAANKTFQVSRKPQYKRDKPRSPLASLNEGKSVRQRSLTKLDSTSLKSEAQKTFNLNQKHQTFSLSDQENVHQIQRNSPLVLLVPAAEVDSGNVSLDTTAGKPENKELSKIFNKTMSPIGTPERFKKLMPCIQSESPLPTKVKSAAPAPVLSLKDALTIIDSDLSNINASPRDASSSSDFSDSLESKSGKYSGGPDTDVLKYFPESPEQLDSNEPRLTFFVSKKVAVNETVDSEPDVGTEKVKKTSFTSVTVTKSKAPVEENCLSGRKIKKSRRRLLEKTLELSDSSNHTESGPGTPSLPVIDTGTSLCDEFTSSSPSPRLAASPAPVTFPVSTPPSMAPSRFSFSVTSPPPSALSPLTFTVASPSPVGSSSPLHRDVPSNPNTFEEPLSQEMFPIHVATKSKKRKSEEYLKSDGKIEDVGKTERVKRSRVVAGKTDHSRPVQEKRGASQRQRTTGELSHLLCEGCNVIRGG